MSDAPMPLANLFEEANRLQSESREVGIDARLLGGIGVVMHAHGVVPVGLRRDHHDLDFIVRRSDGPSWRAFLLAQGYEEDMRFNSVHGHQRLLHWDRHHGRQLDTFVERFEMCHSLDIERWWGGPPGGLPPADLLLTKLQVVEVNDKDLLDTLNLLVFHPIASGDPDSIEPKRIADVVGQDWGWYTTVSDNLTKLEQRLPSVALDEGEGRTVYERIAEIRRIADETPKSLKWRLRARVGRRVPWYVLPEEEEE